MSKINAVRIINLNYNNNSMRISDEIFQMGGESTLLSLRNGGGKSVLVQMLMAPFVHKQYRKTKDRPFESYFTTSKPTFIMVEWVLDQGAGYCLTGMMVRKNQASEEQSSEPLEIIHFISEYPSRCEHDIYHIPVVEKSKNEVILKNFNATKQLFEMYKKDHSKKFFYYDMNNYAQSRQYFDKLAEYKIYFKEWETIIRKVNLKESGLSELFSDCKNEKELIEKWFLESIQEKLNQDQNRIKEFQSIIDKYIRMYKDNKSKIERRDTILKFKEDMLEVEEKAKFYQETQQGVKALENQIACFRQELEHLEEDTRREKLELEIESKDCDEKMSRLLYEKLSMEIHALIDEWNAHISNRDGVQEEMEGLESEIQQIEKMVHLYECAKQQEIIDSETKEYEILTQKIDVSRKNEKELEPERRRIGGHLRQHFEKCLEDMKEVMKEKDENYQEVQKQWQLQEKKEEECEQHLKELLVKIASCNTRIEGFKQKEDEFNQAYQETLARNILGDYEPGMLEIKKEQYEKQLMELVRSCSSHLRQRVELEEKKKSCERSKEDRKNEKQEADFHLRVLKEKEKEFEEQVKERHNIMRYLGVEDSLLWQQDKLIKEAERKIEEINRTRSLLEQEKNILSRECKKLTSGEVLELPQEFKDLLDQLSLHPVYGMNWLDKNGYSLEENKKLVRKQPFLPYALILPRAEIKKLEMHGKEIYTSFPIPIIPREALEEVLMEEESSVLNFSGISFYLWFNEKLLDEEELRLLITQKEMEINKKKEQIALKTVEHQEYVERLSVLKKQTVTKEKLEQNRKEQEEFNKDIENIEKALLQLKEEVLELENKVESLHSTVEQEKQDIEWCKRRKSDFERFCEGYIVYQNERKTVEDSRKEQARYEQEKEQAFSTKQQYAETLKSLVHEKQKLTDEVACLNEKLIKYEGYESEEGFVTNLLPEELEARYEAITTKMSSVLQELEHMQEKTGNSLVKEKAHLKKLKEKYQVLEREWKEILYNEKEQLHQEILLEDKKKKWKNKERLWHMEDKKIDVIASRIQDKKIGMLEQCGYEKPLPKTEIHTTDFETEMNKLKYDMTEIEKKCKRVESHLSSINENLAAFSEYQDFAVEEAVVWEEDFAQMDAKSLREFAGMLRRDYRHETEKQKQKKDKLEAQLNMLLREEVYQEDYYKKPLEAMLAVTEQANQVLAQLDTTIRSYDSQMAKLAVDISMVEKEKDKIESLLEDYVKEVHSNMGKIDNNSTITIRERPIKMLRLQIPDWDENEGLYHQRFEDFMDELTRNGIEIYEQNENAADYLSSRITTKNLYDTIVGVGNIQIKLYKIEEQREYPITWAEVARNSGGEGFLSAFVILSSLLHFMRRDETDIFADRNEGKVLIMDNPFAQTNAAHLLKPLMDMAKKTNTQLICLSGLGGDSIYSRFDNIYVLNLVSASLRGGMQYLRGEHTRGAEEEVMVSSQIEVMEQQSFLF